MSVIPPGTNITTQTSTPTEIAKAYELGLAQIKTLEDRRQSVSATYLSVNGALTTAIAFIVKDAHLHDVSIKLAVGVFLVCGIISCRLWRAIIYQLSRLIGWWYGRVRDLETHFPKEARVMTMEYERLYTPKANDGKPLGLTKNEIALTWLFTVIYAMFFAAGFWDLVKSGVH